VQVAEVVATFGRVDILVNNVGIVGARGNAVDVDPDEWDKTMRDNIKSMMLMAEQCVPEMEAVVALSRPPARPWSSRSGRSRSRGRPMRSWSTAAMARRPSPPLRMQRQRDEALGR